MSPIEVVVAVFEAVFLLVCWAAFDSARDEKSRARESSARANSAWDSVDAAARRARDQADRLVSAIDRLEAAKAPKPKRVRK